MPKCYVKLQVGLGQCITLAWDVFTVSIVKSSCIPSKYQNMEMLTYHFFLPQGALLKFLSPQALPKDTSTDEGRVNFSH